MLLLLVQGLNFLRGFASPSPFPIIKEFHSMQRSPFQHQRTGPAREFASEQIQRRDGECGFVACIFRMEMRRVVVVVVQVDHDPEKLAYPWHQGFLNGNPPRFLAEPQ
jgi:hypothetical protein